MPALALAVVGALTLLSAGCQFGPTALKLSHTQYNQALQESSAEQLLLNLVRLRYGEAPVFLEVGSVSRRLGTDVVPLLHYTGNGIKVEGVNYMSPTEDALQSATDLACNPITADLVLSQMDSADSRLNLVILDECRNNPLASATRAIGGRDRKSVG